MASWKENRMVGIIAALVAVIFVFLAIKIIIGKTAPVSGKAPLPEGVELLNTR